MHTIKRTKYTDNAIRSKLKERSAFLRPLKIVKKNTKFKLEYDSETSLYTLYNQKTKEFKVLEKKVVEDSELCMIDNDHFNFEAAKFLRRN
jgi:hypothetical protein